ncbi:MAG: helicase-related protein, partial [Chlamydiota bacterium]
KKTHEYKLTALALIREAIYKNSQKPALIWPTPTQMLTILAHLNYKQSGLDFSALFLQLATGEGKSLTAIILALLSWLDGKTAAIVTHRESLAVRDANAYSKLFQNLGLESGYHSAENYKFTLAMNTLRKKIKEKEIPEFGDIAFFEFNNLALIRQQSLIERGKDLKDMSFILDEADETILHNHTDNNLNQIEGNLDNDPNGWVFEALAEYIHTQKVQPKHCVTVEQLLDAISHYSTSSKGVKNDPVFLAKLPSYAEAAWQAQTLKEKKHFIVKTQENAKEQHDYAAVLINDKAMPPNVTFSGLIQQALHGRLMWESKKLQAQSGHHNFPIKSESHPYSTMSPRALLKWMKSTGHIVALSATIGSNTEQQEMKEEYNFDFIKFPKKEKTNRLDYPPKYCNSQKEVYSYIHKLCQKYTVGRRKIEKLRSILIVVKDIDEAEGLHKYLKENGNSQLVCLHAGLEKIDDSLLESIEKQCGNSNSILIATEGLVTRGFDIKLSTAKQLVVINTTISSSTNEKQVKGRTGRIHQKTGMRSAGKYYSVYNQDRELATHPHLDYSQNDFKINNDVLKQALYFSNYQKESHQRLHRSLASSCKDTIQHHFFTLWLQIFDPKNEISLSTRSEIKKAYIASLEDINTLTLASDLSNLNVKRYTEQLLQYY